MAIIIVNKTEKIVKNKKKLEKVLKVKIKVSGKSVEFSGAAEDEYEGEKVLEALGMDFSLADALSIKEKELEFDTINIKEYSKKKNLTKVKGRLIGKNGKVLSALAELTKCSLEISGSSVGIIGDPENIKPALSAIIQIIQGSKHANVYKGLEKRKDDPIIDWGLKEKKNK